MSVIIKFNNSLQKIILYKCKYNKILIKNEQITQKTIKSRKLITKTHKIPPFQKTAINPDKKAGLCGVGKARLNDRFGIIYYFTNFDA